MSGEITGEIIKSSMSLKIRDTFKTGTDPIVYPTIYKEQQQQDLAKPYFFIWAMDVDQKKIARNIYEVTCQMKVEYETEDNDYKKYEHLTAVGTELLLALGNIDVPIYNGPEGQELKKPVYGKMMSFKITEGVLQLFVTYVIRGKQVVTSAYDKMGTLTLEIINKE